MMISEEFIEVFIDVIKERYPNLHIEYDYDGEEEMFEVWHNNKSYEFTDAIFSKFITKTAKDILFSRGIYNFSFGYDHYKTKEMNEEVR